MERSTWWRGTDTIESEIFDTTMFTVKRTEKPARSKFACPDSVVSLCDCSPETVRQPIVVENACTAVKSHGRLAIDNIFLLKIVRTRFNNNQTPRSNSFEM